MKRFVFRKIEVWVVLLLLTAALIGTILYGALVRSQALGNNHLGIVGRIAYAIAAVPADAKNMLFGKDPTAAMISSQNGRFKGRAGWQFPDDDPNALPDGYLLFSRFDGDAGHQVIELFDLQMRSVVHRIDLDADTLYRGAIRDSKVRKLSHWTTANFRAIHPLALANGDLIIKDHTAPLWRIDACGKMIWRDQSDLYHHSTERGSDGGIWVTTHIEPSAIPGVADDFRDEAVVEIDENDTILYRQSITAAMLEQGLGYMIFGSEIYDRDPLHLNDVQPVLTDGPYWKKGDLFISLRHASTILLFRPATGRIVWMKQGPWTAQHDVDVVDDHRIAVFNNNMQNRGLGQVVQGNNEILVYDFATGEVTSPFRDLFEKYQIRTESEGLFKWLPDGHLLVEETDAGRFLIFAPDGRLAAENVNRAADGNTYLQGWSRYIPRAEGDRIRDAMRAQGC